MAGIPRSVIEHHLNVCPNVRPVKQKARRQSTEKQAFIIQETCKLEAARVIREVRYPDWVANPVVVPKKGGMAGIPRSVIEHHLNVCSNVRPMKQKARRQSTKKQAFIVQETCKLEAAGVIREVRYPDWLANPVVVPKKGGKERMCVDFTNLNKACLQDPFPLPRIDQIVDSTAECDLLCFFDAFSGYHQIKMAVAPSHRSDRRFHC